MDWKSIEAAADAAVIAAFGETVRHHPMTSSGAADATRPVADIRGILHTPAAAGAISLGSGIITTLSASEGALVVNRADYPTTVFKQKDKIRGLELPGQPWWEIKTVNDRFSSILVLVLNQA
jgi:hypothetical protein